MNRPLFLSIALCFLPAAVAAQEPPPDPTEAVRQAIVADAKAKELFAAGDYAGAAAEFRRSYELDPLPAALKSEIVAWFKAENCAAAVGVAERHATELERLPPAEQEDLLIVHTDCALQRANVAFETDDLDTATAALGEAEASDPRGRKTAEIGALRARVELRRKQLEPPPAPVKQAEARAPEVDEQRPEPALQADLDVRAAPSWQTVAGWSFVGAGASLLAYQTTINLFVQPPQWNEHERLRAVEIPACSDEADCATKRARADVLFTRLDRWANREEAIWVVGGILTAGGVATLLLAPRPDASISVNVGPGSVNALLSF